MTNDRLQPERRLSLVAGPGGEAQPPAGRRDMRHPPATPPVPTVSAETVYLLQQLLDHAKAGRVIGIAAACITSIDGNRRYITPTAGECDEDPTYTVGILKVLSSTLLNRIAEREQTTTVFG